MGPRKLGGPKFALFFFSPATIFFLSSLSWGSFRGYFGGVGGEGSRGEGSCGEAQKKKGLKKPNPNGSNQTPLVQRVVQTKTPSV